MKTPDITLPPSILTKSQKKTFRKELPNGDVIVATVRYDDECGNGHNTFAITGELYDRAYIRGEESVENSKKQKRYLGACGCIHDEVAKHFPELAPLIKWHLVSSDYPLHYYENTIYHAKQNGPDKAWVYYTGEADPLGIGENKERLLAYVNADKALAAEGKPGYRVQWDAKTAKTANLEHARSSAVWPEATDAELMQAPEALKAALLARLPALMAEFKKAVESLGFTY